MSEKTEQPTQRRLEKARKDGRFPVSREFVSAVQFLAFLWILDVYGNGWLGNLRESVRVMIHAAYRTDLTSQGVVSLLWTLAKTNLPGPAMAAFALLGITVSFQLLSTGMGVSLKNLAPSFRRLNPLSKIKQMPRQNLPAFVQSVVLLPMFSLAVYALGKENWETFQRFPMAGIESAAGRTFDVLGTLLWRAGGLFLVFGLVDLVRQRKRHAKDLKMSKQDIRDEYKESEGNPQMKQRVRRLQRDAARRNMMKELPTATAVIVNPTHFSVAIRYSLESSGAPMVVAKGKNYLALRIKAKALEYQIPIVENQPLAQALYKSADVGQEIPAHLYRAVAEVLAYIFKLMNGRLPGRA